MRRFAFALLAALLLATTASAQPKDVAVEHAKNGNIIVYRRVSTWEMRKILAGKGLFVTPGSGESFVSTSREYVDQLGARHPKDYLNLMVIEISPDAFAELEKIGLKASGPLLDRLYPNMPKMTGGRPDAVHFKAELGALNLGFRPESVSVFNKLVKSIRVDESAKLVVPKDSKSIKENLRARRPGMNSTLAVGPDATAEDLAKLKEKVEARGGTVERVAANDPRLGPGVTGRTTLGEDGKLTVLLPEGPVKKLVLLEELAHTIQLSRALAESGVTEVGRVLLDAEDGVPEAKNAVASWEVDAHKILLLLVDPNDPVRETVKAKLAEHERELAKGEVAKGTFDIAAAIRRSRGGSPVTASDGSRERTRETTPDSRGIIDELTRRRVAEDRDRIR